MKQAIEYLYALSGVVAALIILTIALFGGTITFNGVF